MSSVRHESLSLRPQPPAEREKSDHVTRLDRQTRKEAAPRQGQGQPARDADGMADGIGSAVYYTNSIRLATYIYERYNEFEYLGIPKVVLTQLRCILSKSNVA